VRRFHTPLIVLFLLFLATLACGGDAGEDRSVRATLRPTFTPILTDAPQPTDAPAPMDIPVPTKTAAPERRALGGAGELDLEGLSEPSDLTSGRANMRVSISGTKAGETVNDALEWLIEFSSEPRALHVKMSNQGMTFGGENVREMYQLGDAIYASLDDQWRSLPTAEEALEGMGGMELQDFLNDTCGWRRQADAEYEGFPVQHWTMTTEDILTCKSAAEMAEIGDLTAASGNLIIVPEADAIVHMDLILEGTELKAWLGADDRVLDEGRMEVVFHISDMNQPLTIEAPDEALSSKGPLDLEGLSDFSQLTSYRASLQISILGTVAGEAVDGAVEYLIEYTSEPKAQHIQMSVRSMDDSDKTSASDVYQLQDTTYLKLDEGWQRRPTTEEIVAETDMIDPHDMLDGTCGWKQQADVEYQGVLAHRWTMNTEDSLDCPDVDLMEIGNVTVFTGNLLIAAEGNYILHMELILEGTEFEAWLGAGDQVLDEGRVAIVFDMNDVNQPFIIQPPE
jgi:hypothetical protein